MKTIIKILMVLITLTIFLINGCVDKTQKPDVTAKPAPVIEVEENPEVGIEAEKGPEMEIKEEEPQVTSQPNIPNIEKESNEVIKEFTMTAKRFDFTPSTITVNKGDKVKIIITSMDVTHGFSLPDFNINERLEPNQPVTIEFVADKVGTFTFGCTIFCGSGHGTMTGMLIVK